MTEREKKYSKQTIGLRDPARLKRLRAAAKRRGLSGLNNSALMRAVVDQWCDAVEKSK